jgi:hypothetical protein
VSRALADALEKLVSAGGNTAATAFTARQRIELDLFLRQTGALRLVSKGSGARYETADLGLVRSHLNVLRPSAQVDLDPDLPRRANNIARMRDSKGQRHGHATGYLLLKAIGENVTWSRPGCQAFDVAATTAVAGAAAITITPADGWTTGQPVWLVENQALFDRPDWMPPDAYGSLVYYGGQLSNLLLEWTAQCNRAKKIIFFPDYDGVGLLNYARLVEKSITTVEFWLMQNWQALLAKYGNNVVWQNTRSDFEAAQSRMKNFTVSSELDELCAQMVNSGLALEHEAVWLKR